MRRERLWKVAALAATSMTVGVVMIGTPAGAHVAGWAHNWTEHIRPRTDARYYTKTQADGRFQRVVAGSGQRQSAPFGASASNGGLGSSVVTFRPRLPASIPLANAHLQTVGTTSANCPGIGRAAPGHLCVYETFNNSMTTFLGFHDPQSGGLAVRPNGTVLIWTSVSTVGNVRGTWTATAPSSSIAPASAQPAECPGQATATASC
jgi:hypothetical protein